MSEAQCIGLLFVLFMCVIAQQLGKESETRENICLCTSHKCDCIDVISIVFTPVFLSGDNILY